MKYKPIHLFVLGLLIICFTEKTFALEKVTLQLKWYHQFQFAGYYAAVEKGFYQKVGLQVELTERNTKISTIESVLNGSADYGVAGSEILSEWLSGKPVVVLGVIFQHSPNILISKADSGILSPQHLQGRRVMLGSLGGSADISAMIVNEGASIDKMNVLKHSYNINDLINGKVDIMSAYLTDQPFYLKNRKINYKILQPLNYGIDFYGDVLFTSQKEISENPERVKKIRSASLLGWEYAMAHPDEMIELIHKIPSIRQRKISKQHLQYEAETTRQLILPQMIEIGHINPGRWKRMAKTFVDLGLAEPNYSLDGFIYNPNPKPDVKRLYWIIGVILFISVLTILIASVLFKFNRRLQNEIAERKKAEEQIKTSLKEKETLLQEIHHRVKNNMTVISSLLSLQMNQVRSKDAKEALQDSQNRVQSMGMVHETLYRSDTLSAVDLKTYLSELGRNIFKNYSISAKVKFKVVAENIMVSVKQASPIGLIVNELIANCLKYAFTDDREGEILLELKPDNENGVELAVSDNGVGISDGFDLKNADSLGLKLVKMLVENQLDGSIDMESSNGTKFTIKFNIKT